MKNDNILKETILKTLAVVGAIVILSFGGYITIKVLTNLPGIFSNITAQVVSITQRFIPSDQIELTLSDKSPKSGSVVKLTFDHTSKTEDGSYSFFYECKSGTHFERTEAEGGEVIFCNTPYNFINSNNTFFFKVFSTNDENITVPLSVNFVKNNSTRISERGEENIEIKPADSTGATDGVTILVTGNTNTNVPRTPGNKVEETVLFNESTGTRQGISNPNGVVDLKPTIIAIGMVNRTTNVFTATTTISQEHRGAVKFVVENIGTKISPTWTFNVVLPTFPSFIYHSKSQQALYPGDKIEYVVGFDSIRNDNLANTIIVNVDPISSVKESNETNNIVSVTLPAYSSK